MAEALKLPLIDLSSSDRISTSKLIRQACVDCGFFYIINHGIEEELIKGVFDESKKFFTLPLQEKMKLGRKGLTGYSPMYVETLDPKSGGDPKESFYTGPTRGAADSQNQWPSDEVLPSWRSKIESFHEKLFSRLGGKVFRESGGTTTTNGFLRLLRYPGEPIASTEETCGASAHSDYGMITLLVTEGVRGLQICREKEKHPRIWEDVHHVDRAFIVNIGDMLERWTNCLFRSTLHRVLVPTEERYSIAFFLDPNDDCIVECLESCRSKEFPPRFPPIRSGDYLRERLSLSYASTQAKEI